MPELAKNEMDARKLRESLHEKIDRLPQSSLAAADRLLLQVEVGALREELDSAFDQDRAESRLSDAKVGEAIALHRARNPYAG